MEETLKTQKAGWAISEPLLKEVKKLATKSVKLGSLLEVFLLLSSDKVLDRLGKAINITVRKYEEQRKKVMLDTFVSTAREDKKVFYLCSSHNDSADDHKDYQGKMYIDSNWRSIIRDETTKKNIEDYIKKHKIKTFQLVTGKPVWLITRPNCRHYFKTIKTDLVLNTSVSKLITMYDMHRVVGSRGLQQTIQHSTRKEWYKKTNVENIISKYQYRLDVLNSMKKVEDLDKTQEKIAKTKFLIKKWQKYLKTHF